MVETKIKIGFVILTLVILMTIGTIAFTFLEGWSIVDSFYFSAMTLTTIGYGDLVPTNDLSKLFAVFYAIMGVALVLYGLGVIAKWYVERSQQFEEHEIQHLRNLLYRHKIPENIDEEKP
ncbi:MAG: hypothetical protein CL943_00960 [Candidatus Diapherotrites archaeon]|uniref:Potassium channel domain-containing protein n=1 Tax=Candidatus Iainarchaeum sp. TaxID=3101447 RepID=A0A2D6M0B1_9ARCH|nr:hypothetical protein [Candidatus Diapherotrites archaeon]|tara:strand:- start:2662 stop:3021 length:360 start_codon:yes stop_codon:yes gene_type:complete